MDKKCRKAVWKRAAVAVMAIAAAFGLTACNGKGESNVTDVQGKQGVFQETDKTKQLSGVLTDNGSIAAMACYEGILYIVADTYPENSHRVVLHTWDREGNKLEEVTLFEAALAGAGTEEGIQPLNVAENSTDAEGSSVTQNVYDFRVTPQGNITYTLSEYATGENSEITEEKKYLKCVDKTGRELFSLDMKSFAEGEEEAAVRSVVFSPDHTFYVLAEQKIIEVDVTGSIINKYNPPEGYADLYSPAFYYKGEPVFTIWNYEGETSTAKSLIFDFKVGKVKKELDIPQNILSQYGIYSGTENGYDLILANSSGLYGYKVGEPEPIPVMNYVASNLSASGFDHLCFLSNTELVVSYYDIMEDKTRIVRMEYVEPDKVPDRQVLTLAMYGSDINLLRKVIEFNRSNPKYKILVTDYSTYAMAEDYKAGVAVMNNEIAAGKVPDIIYNTGSFDFRSYADKGMLADFYELIKTDEKVKLEDYCANVFRAFETDGKLYELAHDFCIETMVGKKSIFGEETSLTWEKMNQILRQYPDASPFYNTINRNQVLEWALRYSMDEFVDWSKAACSFDSKGFQDLLAFASKFPEDVDFDKLYEDDTAWALQEQQFITNASLLNSLTISNVNDIKNFTYGSFLEEVTPVGFPNGRGMGSSICAVGSFGISEKSAHKQTAWEFVRQFILPESQMPKGNEASYRYGLPVYKPALLEMASHMTEKSFYIDSESGEKVYYDNTAMINGQEIVVEPATEQEAKKWVDFIFSVDKRVSNAADNLLKIVNEEAAAYFDGQKTVEDVTKIIQSRMSIYISEND